MNRAAKLDQPNGEQRSREPRLTSPSPQSTFGRFLIDIWRLEIGVTSSKHTTGATSGNNILG